MSARQEHIFIVEADRVAGRFLAHQILNPLGFSVSLESDPGLALPRAIASPPDLILLNLDLPGLSGKDFLAALKAQGSVIPVVVIAAQGEEHAVLQALRLGAGGFLFLPLRETEVVAAVEKTLLPAREQRQRELLAARLHKTNLELKQHVRQLSALAQFGHSVSSQTDPNRLFELMGQAAVIVAVADSSWVTVRKPGSPHFILAAGCNLPASLNVKMGSSWDDGLSGLVAQSGLLLALHGEPLQRLQASVAGNAALAAPVKLDRETVAVVAVTRHSDRPFDVATQKLFAALASTAASVLLHRRMVHIFEERLSSLQKSTAEISLDHEIQVQLLQRFRRELANILKETQITFPTPAIQSAPGSLVVGEDSLAPQPHRSLQQISLMLELLPPADKHAASVSGEPVNINEVVRLAGERFKPVARRAQVSLQIEAPATQLLVPGSRSQILALVEGLLSNAIKFSMVQGKIGVQLERDPLGNAHLHIFDEGVGLGTVDHATLFTGHYHAGALAPERSGGPGIPLGLIYRIVEQQGGTIRSENTPGGGATFHVTLPLMENLPGL